jgi:hypothetical protein
MNSMIRTMVMFMMVFFMGQASFAAASPELRRQLYELNALAAVQKLQVDMYNQDQTWHAVASADFIDGEVKLEMDISAGPGYYRGYASWNDEGGNPLFYSYDYKMTQFKAGINWKDFPVYLSPNRNIQLKIEGPSNSDEVWVNGQRAWFSNGYWHVGVNEPWNVDELSIIWTGHGGWKVAVNPSYPFGNTFVLTSDWMDSTQDSVSQMAAVSFSGEDSWVSDIAGFQRFSYSQGDQVVEFVTSIPSGTKVMVFFSCYDQNVGTVEYYNTTVNVTSVLVDGLMIRVPLTGTWFDLNQTQVRFVFQDANGKYWQTWAAIPQVIDIGTVVVGVDKG